MSNFSFLSSEISKCRSLAAGGTSINDIAKLFAGWVIKNHSKVQQRGIESLLFWARNLYRSITIGMRYGVPVSRILSEIHPMVKREERQWLKLISLERQYGFQGAVAMVMPWGVAVIVGGLQFNMLFLGALALQFVGMAAFYVVVKQATSPLFDERVWLRDFLVAIWMRVLCGETLWRSVEQVIEEFEVNSSLSKNKKMLLLSKTFLQDWKNWFHALKAHPESAKHYGFDLRLKRSIEASELMCSLLKNGAPATQALSDHIRQLDEECQIALEERIGMVPVKLTLIFCVFLTPAVFFILSGALWPVIKYMI